LDHRKTVATCEKLDIANATSDGKEFVCDLKPSGKLTVFVKIIKAAAAKKAAAEGADHKAADDKKKPVVQQDQKEAPDVEIKTPAIMAEASGQHSEGRTDAHYHGQSFLAIARKLFP
jgi:hypothetical protein